MLKRAQIYYTILRMLIFVKRYIIRLTYDIIFSETNLRYKSKSIQRKSQALINQYYHPFVVYF